MCALCCWHFGPSSSPSVARSRAVMICAVAKTSTQHQQQQQQPLAGLVSRVYHFARPCELFCYLVPSRISYSTTITSSSSSSAKRLSVQDNRLAASAVAFLYLLVQTLPKSFLVCPDKCMPLASILSTASLLSCTCGQH